MLFDKVEVDYFGVVQSNGIFDQLEFAHEVEQSFCRDDNNLVRSNVSGISHVKMKANL